MTLELLTQKVEELIDLFKKHKHLGTDMTQKLATGKTAYGGQVNADASGQFPAGWTCTVGGSGGTADTYTITHNLGNTAYTVVAIPNGASNLPIQFYTPSANSFTVQFSNGTNYFATAFNFILTII
jgi:hypothetical protein